MADQNLNNQTVTWNNGALTFDAIKMNVTDTASAAASTLLLLQVAGADKFKVEKDGSLTMAGNLTVSGTTNFGNSPVFTTPQINDTSSNHQYVFAVSELTADRTVTLPLLTGADEFVFAAHTKALTNKDISSTTNTYRQASATVTGAVELATAAEIRTGTDTERALTIGTVYAAGALVALTDAATIAVDLSTFINAHVVIAGNRTLGTPTNAKMPQSGVIRVQASGATRTLTFGSNWFLSDPSPISISQNHELYLYYHVFSAAEPVIVVNPIYNPTTN